MSTRAQLKSGSRTEFVAEWCVKGRGVVCKGKGAFRRSEEAVFRRITRITAWLLLFLIAVFSVISPYYRVVTIIPHTVGHLASFLFCSTLAIGLGYPSRDRVQSDCARPLLSLRSFGLQNASARIGDFLVNLLGLSVGIALAYLVATPKGQLPPFDDAGVDEDQGRLQARFSGMKCR